MPDKGSEVKVQWSNTGEVATVKSTDIRPDFKGRSTRSRRSLQENMSDQATLLKRRPKRRKTKEHSDEETEDPSYAETEEIEMDEEASAVQEEDEPNDDVGQDKEEASLVGSERDSPHASVAKSDEEPQATPDSDTSFLCQETPQAKSPRNAGSSTKKKRRTRVNFTAEEDEEILAGVQEHGKGHWTLIKETSGDALKHRSPGQIKDRYRVLSREESKSPPSASSSRNDHMCPNEDATAPEAATDTDDDEESVIVPDCDLAPKNNYPDRDTFYAALEIYNRKQLDGPGKVKYGNRVFVCRPVKFSHKTPCNECGENFKEENRYLVEFRPWLDHKLCEQCMGSHLENLFGTQKASIFSQLEEIREEQPYPVYTDKHLHNMGGLEEIEMHRKIQEKKEPGPCTCSRCTCECSYCWSEKYKIGAS